MLDTKKPIILSTGLSNHDEVTSAVKHVQKTSSPLALLQCTSEYPCRPEKIGLNVIDEFRQAHDCAVGLSDHSGTIYSGLAAAALNIQVLEIHITFSKQMFGPDVIASVTTDELKSLCDGIRYIETINHHPVDKTVIDDNAKSLREIFMKSIFAREDIASGEIISASKLIMKKPGTGIPANQLEQVIGKKANTNINAGSLINFTDME